MSEKNYIDVDAFCEKVEEGMRQHENDKSPEANMIRAIMYMFISELKQFPTANFAEDSGNE